MRHAMLFSCCWMLLCCSETSALEDVVPEQQGQPLDPPMTGMEAPANEDCRIAEQACGPGFLCDQDVTGTYGCFQIDGRPDEPMLGPNPRPMEMGNGDLGQAGIESMTMLPAEDQSEIRLGGMAGVSPDPQNVSAGDASHLFGGLLGDENQNESFDIAGGDDTSQMHFDPMQENSAAEIEDAAESGLAGAQAPADEATEISPSETDHPPSEHDLAGEQVGEPDSESEFDSESELTLDAYSLCGMGMSQRAGTGTWNDPIRVGRFPFVDQFSTSGHSAQQADRYDCASQTSETGAEVVYSFHLESTGDLKVQLVDAPGVDVDLHLLHADATISNGTVSRCIQRAHTALQVDDLAPGDYLLVADSWTNAAGTPLEGAYELALDVVEQGVWRDVPLSNGVIWSRFRGTLTDGSWQSINVVRIDRTQLSRMILEAHSGCQTVNRRVNEGNYVLGINAGYFSRGCAHKGFLRIDDVTISRTWSTTAENPLPREARVGWRGSNVWFEWGQRASADDVTPATGQDWTGPAYALGAHPMLVENGVARAEVQPDEQVYSAIDWGENPRTAMAHTASGDVLLLTIDGRSSAGAGMSTPALSAWIAEQFDVVSAINFDGGGSTTLVINDCWVGDEFGQNAAKAFNRPSDGSPRGVSSGLYLRP